MNSDQVKILEVEIALDGIDLNMCYHWVGFNNEEEHNEWSGVLFRGLHTLNIYKACRNHLRLYRINPDMFEEVNL